MSTEVRVTSLPNCDICTQRGHKIPAEYDARTVMGPWANMCGICWKEYGIGRLGTGYGQRLILEEK